MILQKSAKSKTSRKAEVMGFIKASGTMCARVTNDQGKLYFVVIRPDGEATCRDAHGEECKALQNGRRCYHIDRVLEQSHTFLTAQETELVPVVEVMQSAQEDMERFERDTAHDAYEQLATTKMCASLESEKHENEAAWARYYDRYGY